MFSDEFKISKRIDEIMNSMSSSFPNVKYYIGQKENSINKSTNYIDFWPESETVTDPHILSADVDNYSYDFCNTRIMTCIARVHGADIESVNKMIYGLLAALKLTAGVSNQISITWVSQSTEFGVTRQGELADVRFNIKLPVPSLQSLLVTPEQFVISNVDFVTELSDGYDVITNEDLQIPPYYSTGEFNT